MINIKKIFLGALSLAALAGSAHAAAPAPAPLSRAEMTKVRGEGGDFISYGSLNKNKVPCSKKGSSHTNCEPGAEANPWTRGCSKITRCARQ